MGGVSWEESPRGYVWYDISFLNYQFSSSTINNLLDSNGLFKIPRDGIYFIELNYFFNDTSNVNTFFSKTYSRNFFG